LVFKKKKKKKELHALEMTSIATARIKREFKEVVTSDEVIRLSFID